MKFQKNQKGLSLLSVVLVGGAALLALTYGRHVINIEYNAYVLTAKVKDTAKENNTDDKSILKSLRAKADFEHIGKIYDDSDVLISKDGGNTVITINYRECAQIGKTYEVCADKEISSK